MAKKEIKTERPFHEMYEEIENIFSTVGGNINEDEDEKIFNAILEHESDLKDKVKLLVKYARELERGIHYSRRN